MSRTFIALCEPKDEAESLEATEPLPIAPPAPKAKPTVPPKREPARVEEQVDDDDTVPFVEVGGPRPRISTPNPVKLAPAVPPRSPLPRPAETHLRFEDASKPQRLMNVSFLAIPEGRGPSGPRIASDLITYHQPNHPVSDQYKQLQQQIARQLPKQDRALIVLTSAQGGAGASTAALNIAISRSFENNGRVLLIDANPGQPSLASRIGCSDQPGLGELLLQSTPLGLTVQSTELHNLQLLAWGRAERHLDEAAWSKLPAIISRLIQRFEWIIVDAPHQIEGLKRWVGLTDAIYMVVRHDEWDSPHVDDAHEAIRRLGGKVRGCLMTAA